MQCQSESSALVISLYSSSSEMNQGDCLQRFVDSPKHICESILIFMWQCICVTKMKVSNCGR